jgi:hypothetical protein
LDPGPGREPVGHLALHHHQTVAQLRQLGQQMQHHRDAHVVGQVGHQRGRPRVQFGPAQVKGVAGVDGQLAGVLRDVLFDGRREPPRQPGSISTACR